MLGYQVLRTCGGWKVLYPLPPGPSPHRVSGVALGPLTQLEGSFLCVNPGPG